MAAAQDDVAVVERLTAQRQAPVNLPVGAVLNDDVVVRTVVRVLVGPGPLAAFQHHGIVVHMHETPVHQHVVAVVNVYGIAAGGTALRLLGKHVLRGRVDIASQETHMMAAIDMVGPERTVHQPHVLHRNVRAVADIGKARTHGFEIGALAVVLPANPKLLPVEVSVAVDGSRAADGEPVEAVGVHQGGEILDALTLHAAVHEPEVADAVAAFQPSALSHAQVSALSEEERSAEEGAPGHHHHAAALAGRQVYHALDGRRLHRQRVVGTHTVVGNHILPARRSHVHARGIAEPGGDGCAVGECGNGRLLLALRTRRNGHEDKQKCQK